MVGELGLDVGGLQVPDAGPVFLSTLAGHVAAGLIAVAAGALTCAAPKRAGRHPRTGLVYWYALGGVFATATVLAALRWSHDRHLFLIAAITFGLATLGRRIRRRLRPGWRARHGCAMAGSYVGLLTGFYVDNGAQLPLWDRLPHLAYWVLPAAVGLPLTWWALVRNDAVRRRSASRSPAGDRAQ